jgi:hypothetical protein
VRISRVSFSLLLPILELTLWLVLVPTQAAFNYLHLRQTAHGAASLRLEFGELTLDLQRRKFLPFAFESAAMRESEIISSINIPGVFIDALVSRLFGGAIHRNPFEWTWEAWRAISYPFFCLPAWWFAGLGLDALLGWRRPRWWTLLIGTLLCAGSLILLLGLRFVLSAQERAGDNWIFLGFIFWTLAFASFPAAWLRSAWSRRGLNPASS